MPKEELQKHAQGRVWSGKRALDIGLIDGLGGVDRAISIAKQEAGIGESLESPAISTGSHKKSKGNGYAVSIHLSIHRLQSALLAYMILWLPHAYQTCKGI